MLKYRCYKREVSVLATTLVEFQNIPKFGFAHHVYTENICQVQKDIQYSFVLVYVKSGHLTAHIYDRTLEAPAGSILILFRHVPFQLSSPWNTPQDYCSIQVYTDYSFALLEDGEDFPPDFAGLALPLVVPPGNEAELIKKDMLNIISSLSVSRERYSYSAAMTMCGILSRLEQKGFLELRTDPEDRRIKRIYVLEKGMQCHEVMHQTIQENEQRMVQGFTPEEQELFLSFLQRAIRNMGGDPTPRKYKEDKHE